MKSKIPQTLVANHILTSLRFEPLHQAFLLRCWSTQQLEYFFCHLFILFLFGCLSWQQTLNQRRKREYSVKFTLHSSVYLRSVLKHVLTTYINQTTLLLQWSARHGSLLVVFLYVIFMMCLEIKSVTTAHKEDSLSLSYQHGLHCFMYIFLHRCTRVIIFTISVWQN